jgi:uncharacterized membrane protein YraQ (UPF0718 family)
MLEIFRRELIYFWYYFDIQTRQIAGYWVFGMLLGSFISVFGKEKIHNIFVKMRNTNAHFEGAASRDTDPNPALRFLKNFGRNVKATGLYFLAGIVLSALFQRYMPPEAFEKLFGGAGFSGRGFGLLMAATIGVPLYVCGGGTIPLLRQWLAAGMTMGSAAVFMITGPASKITNLGALKIVLGIKHYLLYLLFIVLFALASGLMIDYLL